VDWRKRISSILNWFIILVAGLAIFALITEYGFYTSVSRFFLHQAQLFLIFAINFLILIKFLLAHNRILYLKNKRGYFLLSAALILILLAIHFIGSPEFLDNFLEKFLGIKTFHFSVQFYLFVFVLLGIANVNATITALRGTLVRPIFLIPLSFALIIFIGTMFLMFPRAVHFGEKIPWVDALFTATSATCVTGLIIQDTGTYFSRFGQLIILLLIQIGGLGIVTFTTFFSLILGRQLGLREQAFLGDALNLSNWHKAGRLVIRILLFTFVIEGLGILLLYWQFIPRFGSIFHNFYLSAFHVISAFNNAGFSLFSDSLESFKSNVNINLIITTLIILGGLGFPVLFELFHYFKDKITKQRRVISFNAKVILITTLCLIFSGAILIYLFENNRLAGFSFTEKILGSYFQSVTARTAGFNTIDVGGLASATVFILIFLMFIGASPASAGGGIKTTALATLLATVKSWFMGRPSAEIFKRRLSETVVRQALMLFILALVWVSICVFILSLTEKADLLDIIFEEVSAFGTVGLSRGITFQLTDIGKLIIIMSMFVGRVGPVALAVYILERGVNKHYKYPEGKINIG